MWLFVNIHCTFFVTVSSFSPLTCSISDRYGWRHSKNVHCTVGQCLHQPLKRKWRRRMKNSDSDVYNLQTSNKNAPKYICNYIRFFICHNYFFTHLFVIISYNEITKYKIPENLNHEIFKKFSASPPIAHDVYILIMPILI